MRRILGMSLYLLALTLGILVWAGRSPKVAPRPFNGKVVKVVDGDTLDVAKENGTVVRVRLQGIDAPERGQLGGAGAKDRLLISALFFQVRVIPAIHGDDRWGRTVARVETYPDHDDLGLLMVRSGWAYVYNEFAVSLGRREVVYRKAEEDARKDNTGMWRLNPVPEYPAHWRRNRQPNQLP